MICETSSLIDNAYEVGTVLDRAGVVAVLTGGSAATFYAAHSYQSHDLDFASRYTARAVKPRCARSATSATPTTTSIPPRGFHSSSHADR